jgi:hypothetical protein
MKKHSFCVFFIPRIQSDTKTYHDAGEPVEESFSEATPLKGLHAQGHAQGALARDLLLIYVEFTHILGGFDFGIKYN